MAHSNSSSSSSLSHHSTLPYSSHHTRRRASSSAAIRGTQPEIDHRLRVVSLSDAQSGGDSENNSTDPETSQFESDQRIPAEVDTTSAYRRFSCSSDAETLVADVPSSPSSHKTWTNSNASPTKKIASMSASSPSYPPRSDSYLAPKNAVSAFPHVVERRPLIDFVTNDWQSKPQYLRDSSFDSQDSYDHYALERERELEHYDSLQLPEWTKRLLRIQIPRRVQRYVGGYLIFLLAIWLGWLYWLSPAWAHEKMLDESAKGTIEGAVKGQAFGVNMRPEFSDMVHLRTLDAGLIPTAANPDRRLIFIGDIHGCKDEFEALLKKVSFDSTTDHLILTGDLIAKGPNSSGAVDLAIRHGASCVRGNWEDRTLLAHTTLHSAHHPLPGPAEDPTTKEDYLEEESFSHGDYKDRALAKMLTDKQVEWLKNCPVILSVPGVAGSAVGDVVVVHGGLVPGVELGRQDPFQAMNMRSIDLKTRVPSELRGGEPWDKLWNHHQNHLDSATSRTTVVYGHDAKRGLNIQKYTKGLDSGCVKGGSLTALMMDARGRQKVVSVDCKNYRS